MIRGTLDAAGLILDAPPVGEAAARRRVLALWAAGASLRALPDGRWLLLLAAPRTVRAERAPGLPGVDEHGRLLAGVSGAEPGESAAAGTLVELRHGRVARYDPAALRRVDPAAWLARPRRVVE